ncbi:MAG: patatin-like phospholipase family protein [Patescibacteria group bacterium]
MSHSRALIVGPGGLHGAYGAGVLSVLGRKLEPDYFHTVYACSVGVLTATFFVAKQPDTIENTWRHLVSDRQLVNFLNPLFGKEIMDLEYLIGIFSDDRSRLDTHTAFNSPTKLVYNLTNYRNGKAVYISPHENNWQVLMKASCALPVINQPIVVGLERYIDGGAADPLPLDKALFDGHDELVIIINRDKYAYAGNRFNLSWLASWVTPAPISRLLKNDIQRKRHIIERATSDIRCRIIRPSKKSPLKSLFDTDKRHLNGIIDLGKQDAEAFLRIL